MKPGFYFPRYMNDQLTPVWNQVEKLLADGISVIPVRDKDEKMKDGSVRVKKSPYNKWKQYQITAISKEELFHQMEQHNTTAVAMLCGKVSGNLEIIDIDVKWYPGVDALLFKDIENYYPELFSRLRIHQSPSGGYHLVYRVVQDFVIPGNQKLASRLPSEAELLINPKEKAKCFFETRGEGGYVLAPPSMGYVVHKDNQIPTLTPFERESIINICRLYNQVLKPDKSIISGTSFEDNYYDTSPFEHFNLSPSGQNVLLDYGWKPEGRPSGNYIYFTRPLHSPTDTKTGGISVGFYTPKRIFHFLTTSTTFDPDQWYNPSSVLAILRFGGDKKLTYRYLVEQGYGRIKPEVEARLVKKKSIQGKPLPPNASASAKELHTSFLAAITDQHPHGIFWQMEEDRFRISRENLYYVANGLGFRYWQQSVVHIRGFFIHKVTDRYFFDAMKRYIKEEDADMYIEICDTYESFVQRSGPFSITRIQELDESLIIRDTPQTAYKFFANGYLLITAEKYTLNPYENIAGLIWAEAVQPRQFQSAEPGGKYLSFLQLACQYDEQVQYIQRIIGYLAHDFKDETTAYIIVLTEQCEDPKEGGGSGKNIFTNLLSHTITVKSVPGTQTKYDESFMQSWDGERIFAVSDAPKKFDFSFLKELSSGTGLLKKLYKDETTIANGMMPKFIIQTNYSYEVQDGGLKRRIVPLEFTDFFTHKGGVDVHFGCHFPNGWDLDDWIGYDNTIAACISNWLSGGLKLTNHTLSVTGWLKQFDQSYMQLTREFIEANWETWKDTFVSNSDFNAVYRSFITENNVQKTFELTSLKMNRALQHWCEKEGYVMRQNITKRENGIMYKGREFLPKAPF